MLLSYDSNLILVGFALNDCIVEIDKSSVKYLMAVHRTALQIAVQNLFGTEIGGFWLTTEQISQLRKLPEYYSPKEAVQVAAVVEAYLRAQLSSARCPTNFSLSSDDCV